MMRVRERLVAVVFDCCRDLPGVSQRLSMRGCSSSKHNGQNDERGDPRALDNEPADRVQLSRTLRRPLPDGAEHLTDRNQRGDDESSATRR